MRLLLPLLATACLGPSVPAPSCAEHPCDGTRVCDPTLLACVEPSQLGSPRFEACQDAEGDAGVALADKATAYGDRLAQLHLHPQLGVVLGVELAPGADPATATWEDVVRWRSGENDGLWSALALAGEAFHAAATTGAERTAALDRVHAMLLAERERMDVSGVPGNVVRQYVKPGIDGLDCPADDEAYRADVEKDDNRWVRVDDAGCITHLPADGGDTWVVSDTCPGPDFAGWCFLDNTSKDEYAGHLLALGAVLRHVDDPASVALAEDLLRDIADHLLDEAFWLRDHDGRRTEHGDFTPAKEGGLAAAMALATFRMAASQLGDPRYVDTYDCLTGRRAEGCPAVDPPVDTPFVDWLDLHFVHLDARGCLSNDNVASMFLATLHTLITWEDDPDLRATYQAVLREVWEADNLRALGQRQNAWYDLMWAASKPLGEGTDGPAYDAVHEAACGLRQFPLDQVRRDTPVPEDEVLCLDRLDRPMTDRPLGPHERCVKTFLWWNDQYVLRGCEGDPAVVEPPADFLLPYWMGRHHRFFTASF